MKDTYYFSHDYSTRTDPKIKKLIQKHGMPGYGIFWTLVEDLYQNANQLPADYESIAYDLRVDTGLIESIINDFGLFRISGGLFSSDSIARRLQHRMSKIEKAKKSAEAQWNKHKEDTRATPDANASKTNANAMQGQYKRNAIKERKKNESTEKKSKENESIEEDIKAAVNEPDSGISEHRDVNFSGKISGTHTSEEKTTDATDTHPVVRRISPSQVPRPVIQAAAGVPAAGDPAAGAPVEGSQGGALIPGKIGDGTLQQQCRRFATDNHNKYPPKMYLDFLLYWTAPVQNGRKSEIGKEKWRIQVTFQLASRLSTWFSKNPNQYQQNGTSQSAGLNTLKHLGATAIFSDDKDYSGRT